MFKVGDDSSASNNWGHHLNQKWKSDAFLNFYLPAKDGGRKKIGSIGLKKSRPIECQLIEFLSENPEARVGELLAKLEVDFRVTNGGDGSALDL
jgi:hypothetical protein